MKTKIFIILTTSLFILTARAQEQSSETSGPETPPLSSSSEKQIQEVETSAPAPKKGGKKLNVKLNFEDELVNGQYNTPDAMFLRARQKMNANKMLYIKKSFDAELVRGKANLDP